ncbi:MAG: glycosyltransferase family 4 protein [bacterium]|nr:glycosyltransferase family 4 protein [bacterium]
MIKILYIVHRMELSGAPISLLRVLRHLDRSRFEPVVLATRPGPMLEAYREQGIECRLWKERENFFSRADILRLVRLIAKNHFDIVHVNTGILPAAALAAGLSPAKCVWHLREVPKKTPNWRWRLAGKFTDLFIFNHYHTYNSVAKMVKLKNWKVIYNGIEIPPEPPAPKAPGPNFKIAMVSNIEPPKGQIHLVEALAEVKQRHPRLELHLVGECFDRDYLAGIKDRAEKLGVLGEITFHGRVFEPGTIVRDCDLVAHTAVNEAASGNIILEAMALGKPVVAFWGGEPPEMIREGETGYLVPRPDTRLLAERISALIENVDLRNQMGKNAYREAKNRFSADVIAKEIMDTYNSLLVGTIKEE